MAWYRRLAVLPTRTLVASWEAAKGGGTKISLAYAVALRDGAPRDGTGTQRTYTPDEMDLVSEASLSPRAFLEIAGLAHACQGWWCMLVDATGYLASPIFGQVPESLPAHA